MQVSEEENEGRGQGKSGYQKLQLCVEMDWRWLGSGVPDISCTWGRKKKMGESRWMIGETMKVERRRAKEG